MGKFQQIASVFMGLFVYSAALIGVFKNRWKVMFGKWSIIMPEFLLRVPRWSELGGAWADLGLSIVGINYNPIITSIVWTLSCELLQLCSPSLFCQCSIRWQSRDRWSVFVWFITRRSILGSDGMTKSDCSLVLWVLFKCSLSFLWTLA